MRKIETEILEKLKNKYGITKLRKSAELYGLGIPEKYWNTKPTEKEVELIADIIQSSKEHSNLVLWCNHIASGNRIASEMLKISGNLKNSRYLDFVSITNEMVDKFGQMNMNLINELGTEDVIVISNIKQYGEYYQKRVYPMFASFLDSLLNGILEKKIFLVLEITDDGVEGIDKSYGDELTKTLNAFNFYQLPNWISINEKE